jgi:hypothetical protein
VIKTVRVRWAWSLKSVKEMQNPHRIVDGKSERRIPFGGPIQT